LEEPGEIHVSPVGSLLMIVAYALPVIKKAIPFTYREAGISSESKMWKNFTVEEMNSLHKNNTSKLSELSKRKKAIDYK